MNIQGFPPGKDTLIIYKSVSDVIPQNRLKSSVKKENSFYGSLTIV